jgi:hypothetical protein
MLQERSTMMAMVIDRKPRIRDHGQFWTWFAVAVLAALTLVGVAFVAAGITLAAAFIAIEVAIAMGLGIR